MSVNSVSVNPIKVIKNTKRYIISSYDEFKRLVVEIKKNISDIKDRRQRLIDSRNFYSKIRENLS